MANGIRTAIFILNVRTIISMLGKENHIILINSTIGFLFTPDKSLDWYERMRPIPLSLPVPVSSATPVPSFSQESLQELQFHHHVIHLIFSDDFDKMSGLIEAERVGVLKCPRFCSKQETPESLQMSVHPARLTRPRCISCFS